MKDIQTFKDEDLLSKVITFLRFPLIIGVVMIHTQILFDINGIEATNSITHPYNNVFPIYERVIYLFAHIITRISVPMFYMFSGFLFFYKKDTFTNDIYIDKVKKRLLTLFVPYLIWNILYIFCSNLSCLIGVNNEELIGSGYTIVDWLKLLYFPPSVQFGFIRDLLIMVICSPIIYWLIKKIKLLFIILAGLFWYNDGYSADAIFFFSLGAYLSIQKINFAVILKPHTTLLGIIYVILISLALIFMDYEWSINAKKISIIIGLAFFISLSASLIAKGTWKINKFLADSNFFIYAYHTIAIPVILLLLKRIYTFDTDIELIILYFLWNSIVIALGLFIYYIMKKYLPKITNFITGGRI